jgi:diguanylate cyclase (GGDEF)-like protein
MRERRRIPLVPVAGGAVALVLAVWCTTTTAALRLQVFTSWLAVAVFASAMSYFAFRAGKRMDRTDPRRRFWIALGAASAVFAVGEWGQVATAVVAPVSMAALTGTGGVRTAALATGCLLLIVVVMTYPIPRRSARDRLCFLLDLATVVTAAGTYGIYWTVAISRGDSSIVANDLVTVTAGPIVAMLTAFSVGRLYLSGVAPFNWAIGILGPLASVVEALARALGPELVHAERPGFVLAMTVGSHALLMIAAWGQHQSAGVPRKRREADRKLPFSLLPYAALWTTFALVVGNLLVGRFDIRMWVAVTGLAVITALVVARQLTSFIANAELLAERDALAARLHTMAFTDSLTGLGNRALFLERLDHALRQDTGEVGVLLIDLDDFKPVNDSFGHAAGDAVLVQVASRLRTCLASSDVVIARLGGDEFAVLVDQPGGLSALADSIVQAVERPCALDCGDRVRVSASIGGATASAGNHDASALLHAADQAMYAAKNSDKGSYRVAVSTSGG